MTEKMTLSAYFYYYHRRNSGIVYNFISAWTCGKNGLAREFIIVIKAEMYYVNLESG